MLTQALAHIVRPQEQSFWRHYAVVGAIIVLVAIVPKACCQTVNLGNDVARPMPGKGHDYVHGLSETVNPANGTLSIKIDLPVPKGRGITLPFAVTYNSGEVYRFTSLMPGCGGYGNAACSGATAPVVIDGWSNTLPYATYSNSQVNLPPYANGGTYCDMTSSYNFFDPSGGSHMLGLAGISSEPGSSQYETSTACFYATYSPTQCFYQAEDGFNGCNGGFQYDAVASGGDDQVTAKSDLCNGYTVAGYPPLPADCDHGAPNFTVTDTHGTVYSFKNPGYVNGNGTMAEYPQTIEDRNGNILTINAHEVGAGNSNAGLGNVGPVTLTDTLGRVAVSVANSQSSNPNYSFPSGYTVGGVLSTSGQQVIGGLVFTPTWEIATKTATFSSPDAIQIDIPPSSGSGYDIDQCSGNFSVTNDTVMGISSLSLPNGQSYNFKYDPNWGLVNEIDYPDGGWVKYTWKMSDNNNELATFNAKQSDIGAPPLTGYCNYRYQTPVVATRTVGYSPNSAAALTQTFTYSTTWNAVTGSWTVPSSNVTAGDERAWQSKTTTVDTTNTLPNGTSETSQTVYQYGSVYQPLQPDSQGQMPAQLAVESQVSYYDWGNTSSPLKTEYKAWYDQFDMAADTTVLSNGWGTQTVYCYVGGDLIQEEDQYNTLTSRTIYAQSTTAAKTTLPSSCSAKTAPKSTVYGYYAWFGEPNQIVTYSSGTRIAETDAYYDGFSVLNPAYNTSTIPATPPAATPVGSSVTISSSIHDETNYGVSSTIMRGNPTQVVRWANVGNSPITTYTYDQTGQVRSKTDACGKSVCSDVTGSNHTSTYSYSDNFTTLTKGENDSYTPALSANAYLTSITDPLGHQATFQYDYYSGQLTASKDVNQKPTYYLYNDPLNRLTLTAMPDGGQTAVVYYDPEQGSSDMVPTITTSELLSTGEAPKVTIANLDGMGHVTSTVLQSAPEGPNYTATSYDGMGLPFQTTNPYVSTSDSSYGVTTHTYDALGRKILLTNPDGTSVSWCYSGAGSGCPGVLATGYSSVDPPVSWVDSYDELGNHHQNVSDGFGRLIAVMEPNGATAAPTMETDYSYDMLGNLLGVTQNGTSGSTARVRSFTYDSLSRLITSNNPEAGLTSYTYDGNGNLLTKTSPAVNAATGTQTISYCYDALNRLTYKFWPGVTANCASPAGYAAAYTYDSSALPGAANTVGRLTDEKSYIGGTLVSERSPYNYDVMGRLLAEQQNPFSPNAVNYQFLNSYDLAGNVTCANNGFAAVTSSSTCNNFTPTANSISELYTYDAAGRLSAATIGTQPWNTAAYPAQLFQANSTSPASYDPMGHLVNAQFAVNASTSAAAIRVARQYDNRGRIQSEIDTGNGTNAGAAGSAGIITMAGTEVGPLTVSATSGTGVLSVTGSDGFQVVCSTIYVTVNEGGQYVQMPETACNQVNDTGTLSVTLGGFTSTATYAGGTSDASVAQQLVAGFAASGSPVTAVQSGSSITLTANTTGNGTNYPITISNGGGYTISDPRATLTGGHSASTSVYDAGTATVTIVNNAITYTATANWGQGSTQATVGASLVSAINSAAGSVVTAKQDSNSGDVLLSSKASGLATDYSVSAAIADSQQVAYPANFPNPSFSISANAMAGGDTAGALYAYFVPAGGYAPNGNILSQTDSVMGTWNYTYDTLNRLTGSVAGSNVPTPLAGLYGCWTYDGFGNRTLEAYSTASSTPCAAGANANAQYTATPQSAAANNRLASTLATYDGAGNVIADSRNAYLYDPEGRLCAVETNLTGTPVFTQYLYDAEGRRVAKGSGTSLSCNAPTAANGFALTSQYLLDQAGEQASELTGAGAWLHSNVWQGGRLTGTYDARGLHFALSDPLGTKRVQATVTSTGLGAPELNFLTLPYGNNLGNTLTTDAVPVGAGGTDATEHHFTGKERDAESGNDYFGARYYASSMGRFLSPDWSAKVAPVPYANLDDPQSLNLYAYVRNNPLSRVDLDGHNDYLWQRTKNLFSGKGWKTDAQVKGWSVAQTAKSHENSMDWAINTSNSSGKDVGHPQNFPNSSNKCNEFVGDTLSEAGKQRPEITVDGKTRMPTAHELADPNVHIPGLSDPKPLSEAQPGDVIAQAHGAFGHSGIVVSPGETASVNTAGDNGGKITVNPWGFRTGPIVNGMGPNGESATDRPPVVRTPQ